MDRPSRNTISNPEPAMAPQIAVLIPCFNEQATIPRVIAAFRASLPEASIYVYDNNSTDHTVALARAAGAIVRQETLQGKGHVVRRMFADIDADVYVLVDGDDTYDAAMAPVMVRQLLDNMDDMVTGTRISDIKEAYRFGHRFGNKLLTGLVRVIFGDRIKDMLSGYRVFSRRFVKSFPALASGFETETEFTVHALDLDMPVSEVETRYKDRPPESVSKLSTVSDGFRILGMIIRLVKEARPFAFFGAAAGLLALAGVVLAVPVVLTYLRTGLVPRLPTAILSASLVEAAFLALVCGLVLDSVARARKEAKRLAYLSVRPVGG